MFKESSLIFSPNSLQPGRLKWSKRNTLKLIFEESLQSRQPGTPLREYRSEHRKLWLPRSFLGRLNLSNIMIQETNNTLEDPVIGRQKYRVLTWELWTCMLSQKINAKITLPLDLLILVESCWLCILQDSLLSARAETSVNLFTRSRVCSRDLSRTIIHLSCV